MRDAPRLLFPECVEFATLDAGEVDHRGFEQLREEVADDHRHGQGVAAEDHLEEAQRSLACIRLGHAGSDRRPVLADVLDALDSGQLAQLLERVRHLLRISQIELLHVLDPLAREQLHRRAESVRAHAVGRTSSRARAVFTAPESVAMSYAP